MQSQQFTSNLLNHAMNNPAAAAAAAAAIAAGMPHMQLPGAMQGNIYDHPGMHPGGGMNGAPKPPGPGPAEMVYLGGQPHAAAAAAAAMSMMAPNPYMSNAAASSRNAAAVSVDFYY